MPYKDIREFIDRLESEGELIRVKEELDPRYEISAVFRQLGQKEAPAALIERVKGYDIPIVGNLLGTRRRIALALETDENAILDKYEKAGRNLTPPVSAKEAPVKQVVHKDEINLLKTMPVLTYHEKDAGPYITQGVIFTKDPETGARSMGIHRIHIKGKDRLGMYISPRGTMSGAFLLKADAKGQPFEIAIAIGVDPVILLVAGQPMPPSADKLSFAGGLRGGALELVKAETVDLEVPANAMFIIEGKTIPRLREMDGPFGESTGFYFALDNPVAEVTAITHQENPIYAIFQPYTVEDFGLITTFLEPEIYKRCKMLIPSLQDMVMMPPLYSTVIMSIKKGNKWDARTALYTVLTMLPIVKYAIVVDDDIDIRDTKEVSWALYGRFHPDEDLIVVTGLMSAPLAPLSTEESVGAKMGLDATKPVEDSEPFAKAIPSADAINKAAQVLKMYLQHG